MVVVCLVLIALSPEEAFVLHKTWTKVDNLADPVVLKAMEVLPYLQFDLMVTLLP